LGAASALRKHPWRVSNPDEAKIFFVPAYMSAAIHRPDRNEGQCGDPEVLFQNLASYLRSSKYFQKNHGRDHLISSFNFPAKGTWVGDMKELLEVMNVVHVYGDSNVGGVLDNNPDLAGLPHGIFAPYGDVLDRLSQTSIASGHTDFWERQTQLFFMGEADNRDAYKDRRIAFTQLAGFPNSTLICVWECSSLQLPACSESHELNGCHQAGSLTEYVKHLRKSRFGLFLRGDTDDSGRLYDYIAAGVVPVIVTSDAQYQNKTKGGFEHRAAPFWSDLPWSEFAFFFPESSFRDDPKAAMNYVLQSSEELIRHKVNGLGEVRRALDWLPDDEGGTKVPSLILRETLRNMGEYVSPVDFLELPSAFFASEDLEALRAHRVDSL
jgi:hypothetical protein